MTAKRLLRRFIRCGMIALLCSALSGCWDRVELQEMSIIMGMGIDRKADGSTRVTAQIIDTSGSGASKGNTQDGKSFLLLEEEGPTLEEAMQDFFGKSARRMFFSHIAIVVFGADYAKHGLEQALEYFERNRDFRRVQHLAVTGGTAVETLKGATGVESISAKGILELVINQGNTSVSMESSELLFDNDFLSASHAPILSWVDTNAKNEAVVKGIGVFRGDRLAGLLEGTKSRGVLWFLNKVERAQLELPCENSKHAGSGAMIEVRQIKVKVSPVNGHDEPEYQVRVNGKGEVKKMCTNEKFESRTVRELEVKLAKAIQDEMTGALAYLQKSKTDAVQFGSKLFAKDPRRWRNLSQEWPDHFANAKADYSIDIQITHPGMISKPLPRMYDPKNSAPKLNWGESGP